MSSWQITVAGQVIPSTVSGLQRRRSSQASDAVGFDITDGPSLTVDSPLAPLAEVVILKDGTRWFVGRVVSVRRGADGKAERLSCQVAGPWWYLENLVYQQTWHIAGGGDIHKSHCLLNTWADGNAMGVRDQLNDILGWVANNASARFGSAPFQWDPSEFPDALIPADEVRDITCAEALTKQLRWVPDAVTWWDYATNPPTFHCRRRSDLSEVTVAVGAPLSVIELNPRNDLLVPAVVLKYERIDTVDGVRRSGVFVDKAPETATGAEFGALTATIDLEGWSINSAEAQITTADLPSSAADWWAWLKKKEPWLNVAAVTLVEPVSVGIENSVSKVGDLYPRELVDGQIAAWMGKNVARETITIEAHLSISGTNEASEQLWKTFSVNIVTTDAVTGFYRQATEVTEGEDPPIGLAKVLHDALSVLEWEGTFVLVQEDVGTDGTPTIGQRVNLSGGRTEWETMQAVVQEVVESVDTGTTSVRVGPPQHLGPRDMVELLRVNRFRFVYTAPQARSGGSASVGGIELGTAFPVQNSTGGSITRERLKLSVAGGSIDLNSARTVGHPMSIQEVAICVDGVEKKMLILCSEPY